MTSKCKIDKNGNKYWFNENGRYHREDGPAKELINGDKEWLIDGMYHRLDGPAKDLPSRERFNKNALGKVFPISTKHWYINDVKYTKKQYWQKIHEMGLITKEQLFIELL